MGYNLITAPSYEKAKGKTLFLAGGITNCPDWQKTALACLDQKLWAYSPLLTVFNPRRENFPIGDPDASREQITWEYTRLRESDMIMFWFSRGSLNPIVLYELGMWGNSRVKDIYIGCDPGYERISDVHIQTELARPDINIKWSIPVLAGEIAEKVV